MVTCDFCSLPCVPTDCTLGYGTMSDGKNACFACCAWLDAFEMANTAPGTRLKSVALYASSTNDVSNWPGSLRTSRTGLTKRTRGGSFGDVYRWQIYFNGPEGSRWSGHGLQQRLSSSQRAPSRLTAPSPPHRSVPHQGSGLAAVKEALLVGPTSLSNATHLVSSLLAVNAPADVARRLREMADRFDRG